MSAASAVQKLWVASFAKSGRLEDSTTNPIVSIVDERIIEAALSRGSTGRLKVEIESFRVGEQGPSRIEMGPLHKLARSLKERYSFTGEQMVQILGYLGSSARLIAEVAEDMKLGAAAEVVVELETEAA